MQNSLSGWLWVYLLGTVPLVYLFSAGLSGWFFDYPLGLFLALFLLFAVPLVLLVCRVPSAPAWNIGLLWAGTGLITVRVVHGVLLMDRALQRPEFLAMAAIVAVSLGWAVVWTRYFLVSQRVAQIFG